MDDAAIDRIVRRLARPTSSGGHVVERAAVLAEGANCSDIEAWIVRNGGEAEVLDVPEEETAGIFAGRNSSFASVGTGHPARYLLPPEALPAQRATAQEPT